MPGESRKPGRAGSREKKREGGGTLLALGLCLLAACRESGSPSAASPRPIVPNAAGANGCSTPNGGFAGAPLPLPLAHFQPSAMSQVTAAAQGELLYATGAGATVVAIDVSDPAAPLEQELVSAGTVAGLYASLGISTPPVLSGVAVLDATRLVVVEHAANVLLSVDRVTPQVVEVLAGQPNTVPGNADGAALGPIGTARFSFEAPCQVRPAGAGELELYVADSGNHALRLVSASGVVTLAGMGFPLSQDGSLAQAAFDTPSGLTVGCGGELLISELGAFGGGQRIRRLFLFSSPAFFGGLDGTIETFVGDGTDATAGGGTATDPSAAPAQVSRPVSPFVASGGEVYWIDSGTGVLRRLAGALVDCPFFPDCTSAVNDGPLFTPGGLSTLTQTPSGTIYVLDAEAGVLFRLP